MARALWLLPFVVLASTCSKSTPPATAYKTTSRTQLIGGQRALGEVGDYKLSNGLIHVLIQDVGYSRGFGAFGGSLIDIDLVRGNGGSQVAGVKGNDYFTEMFPAFFLQAIEPSKVEVVADGADGGAAVVRVTGSSGDFISLLKLVNDIAIPKVKFSYQIDYILEPGKKYVKMVATITNAAETEAQFPLSIPFGFITLLGEGQRLFVPGGAGFDMRYYLEDVVFKRDAKLEALPGAVTSMWATEGNGVSYAFAAGLKGATYMASNPTFYPGAKRDSLLIPLASSSFLGSYWAKSPAVIPPGRGFSYTGYLAVGEGDVASAQKVVYELDDGDDRKATPYGALSGRVVEQGTNLPLENVSVVIEQEGGEYRSQARTVSRGVFSAPVPPGRYRAVAVDNSRPLARAEAFIDVAEGQTVQQNLMIGRPAELEITIVDERGRRLPAKVSVEGVYEHTGVEPPRDFLYDLKLAERFRPSDLAPDTQDPATRRYLEKVMYVSSGSAVTTIRPGQYTVHASRGIEYGLTSQAVTLVEGQRTKIELKVEHLVPTPGWVSGDYHVHSINSVDSAIALKDRVATYAVEGIDHVTATDHNYVTDFSPSIEALGLSDWLASSVGLELTSLEMGHFNGYPLKLDPGAVTHGSFRWFRRPPGELFAQLRGLGKVPEETIVQVNHPRDTVLGYFNAFNIGTYSGVPIPPVTQFPLDTSNEPDGGLSPYHPSNFSLDFDVMEVMNGKRDELIFTYRVPEVTGPGPEPTLKPCMPNQVADCIPAVGEVLHTLAKFPDGGTQLQPVYPGAQEEWFTLLSQGKRITATGNSDSHGEKAEAGLPRTYSEVGPSADGSMRGLSEAAVMAAIKEGRSFVTNGPLLEVSVNGKGLGSDVVAPDGIIDVKIVVKAAPWVDITKVVVRRGGKGQGQRPEVLDTITVPRSSEVVRLDVTKRYENIADASFIVVEASGEKDMWPVHTPYEQNSLEISDAVGVIGSAFGFGNKYGRYRPPLVQQVYPYGFTNPIWVHRSLQQGLRLKKKANVLPVGATEPFTPRMLTDVRKLFGAFHADAE